MTLINFAPMVGVMLAALILTSLGFFAAPVNSFEDVEQERSLCLQECKYKFGVDMFWGGSSGTGRLYQMCISDCENNAWKEWDKDMNKLDKD
jgi:hypothetical protein